ncbi:hypothetical protein ACTXT7_008297 [Hymenolepis weldensis]
MAISVIMRDVEDTTDNVAPWINLSNESDYRTLNSRILTPSAEKERVIFVNRPNPTKFCSNSISTGKYTFLTFIPKFFYEQFRKYANMFFLAVALFQQIPGVSPTGRFTTVVPLTFILCVSAVKEIIEDYARHSADKTTNNSKTHVLRNGTWEVVLWKDVQVGDVVKLTSNCAIPADLVILATGEPMSMCYIETSNLDGETTLKLRQGLPATSGLLTAELLRKTHLRIECEQPTRTLDEFVGTLYDESNTGYPLDSNQVLLRGATVKNTNWVFGAVIYTGKESKVMLNSTSAPLKRSSVDKQTNYYFIILFYVELTWMNAFYMCITAFIIFHTIIPISLQVTLEVVRFVQALFINWNVPILVRSPKLNNIELDWYLEDAPVAQCSTYTSTKSEAVKLMLIGANPVIWISNHIGKLINVNRLTIGSLIPSSKRCHHYDAHWLFLSSVCVCHSFITGNESKTDENKLLSAILDLDMYDAKTNTPAMARTSNLNEDLGQVKYIFSDKTGTLTKNVMEFKMCSIGRDAYGLNDLSIWEYSVQLMLTYMDVADICSQDGRLEDQEATAIQDWRLLTKLAEGDRDVDWFFTILAVCHTVIPEYVDVDIDRDDIRYQATSPGYSKFMIMLAIDTVITSSRIGKHRWGVVEMANERALVMAAKSLGYVFCEREPDSVTIRVKGKKHQFKLLHVIEFTSDRKRMSVIVEDEDGKLFLMVKGASIVEQKLEDFANGTFCLLRLRADKRCAKRLLNLKVRVILKSLHTPAYTYEKFFDSQIVLVTLWGFVDDKPAFYHPSPSFDQIISVVSGIVRSVVDRYVTINSILRSQAKCNLNISCPSNTME